MRETLAVKCMDKGKVTKTRLSRDNVINEIAILKKLTHRHVVKLVDFRWDNRYIFLIMEYCSGGDLSHFIRCPPPRPSSRPIVALAADVD